MYVKEKYLSWNINNGMDGHENRWKKRRRKAEEENMKMKKVV